MFKPHIGFCIDCKRQHTIVVKAGRCAYCNHLFKEAKKSLKPQPIRRLDKEEKKAVFGSLKKKFREPTGELNLFLKIWEEREHISELSGQEIRRFHVFNFHHILHKKQFKKFILNPDNILLIQPTEHVAIHQGIIDEKYKLILKEKAEELKRKYHQQNSK